MLYPELAKDTWSAFGFFLEWLFLYICTYLPLFLLLCLQRGNRGRHGCILVAVVEVVVDNGE